MTLELTPLDPKQPWTSIARDGVDPSDNDVEDEAFVEDGGGSEDESGE